MTENQDNFTIKEAALYLQVSEPTIYRWMKDEVLSFYKVGRGTRFTKSQLDAVKITHTSKPEAMMRKNHCACCGHGELVPGRLQSTGLIYFKPEKSKFFTLETSMVGTNAWVCNSCGFIQLHADPDKLSKLQDD
jgi:excisionase family DNA binding protein